MLNERQEKILNILIGEYIKNPEPVSSKALVKSSSFSLSSATLRGEMNKLEKAGYLMHLHTSGGRVPTAKAYRFYVDNLMSGPGIYVPEATKKKIHKAINDAGNDPEELNKVVADIVSVLTDNIVVTNVKDSDNFYKTGLSSLFEMPEFREFNRVFNVANVFDHFDRVFSQIEDEFLGINNAEISVIIGEENPVKNIREEAVIMVKYPLPDRKTGSMTIIGPMRMDYGKNIGLAKVVIEELRNKTKHL
jgi:transcriptional regulator of heat shock response